MKRIKDQKQTKKTKILKKKRWNEISQVTALKCPHNGFFNKFHFQKIKKIIIKVKYEDLKNIKNVHRWEIALLVTS